MADLIIAWYTDVKPSNDAQVAAHFSSARPILGEFYCVEFQIPR